MYIVVGDIKHIGQAAKLRRDTVAKSERRGRTLLACGFGYLGAVLVRAWKVERDGGEKGHLRFMRGPGSREDTSGAREDTSGAREDISGMRACKNKN